MGEPPSAVLDKGVLSWRNGSDSWAIEGFCEKDGIQE
jgi:hypothetical protein